MPSVFMLLCATCCDSRDRYLGNNILILNDFNLNEFIVYVSNHTVIPGQSI